MCNVKSSRCDRLRKTTPQTQGVHSSKNYTKDKVIQYETEESRPGRTVRVVLKIHGWFVRADVRLSWCLTRP